MDLIKRKDKEIEELKEKNEVLLGTLFKREKENSELRLLIEKLKKASEKKE